MLRFIVIAILQSIFLSSGQVFLKLAMKRIDVFEWSWVFFKNLLLNWPLAACGLGFGGATVLWLYMLRHFDFSLAYPITSISYGLWHDSCSLSVSRIHSRHTLDWCCFNSFWCIFPCKTINYEENIITFNDDYAFILDIVCPKSNCYRCF